MGDMNKGKMLCTAVGAYMVIKSVINLVFGFGFMNIVWLVVNILLAGALVKGRQPFDIVTGVFLALMFLLNVKNNISGHQWFYLGEGLIDAVCAAGLFINKDMKSHFR